MQSVEVASIVKHAVSDALLGVVEWLTHVRAQCEGRGKWRASLPSVAGALELSDFLYAIYELHSCQHSPKVVITQECSDGFFQLRIAGK